MICMDENSYNVIPCLSELEIWSLFWANTYIVKGPASP